MSQVTPRGGPSARPSGSGRCSRPSPPSSPFASMPRWNKHEEVGICAFVRLFIATSLPDGHIFAERSFHKHQSARLQKHKVVEKQECFRFQQDNKVRRGYLQIQTSHTESHESHRKGSRPPCRESDRRRLCPEDETSCSGKGIFLEYWLL